MITLDLQRIFAERGIQKPVSELIKLGISQPTAHRLLNEYVKSINLDHLEKICLLLNCTPNDLLSYSPSPLEKGPGDEAGPGNEAALMQLKRDDTEKPLSEILRTISIEQLNQLRQILTTQNPSK